MTWRYYMMHDDAVGRAQELYAARGYEYVAAIEAAQELIRYAVRESGEHIEHDGVAARYGSLTGGYAVGGPSASEAWPTCECDTCKARHVD